MNKCIALASLALVCFFAKASIASAADDISGLSSALSQVPTDEQETAGLQDGYRHFSGFCTAARDYIVDNLKDYYREKDQQGLIKKLAKKIFSRYDNVFKQAKTAWSFLATDKKFDCDKLNSYKIRITSMFNNTNEELFNNDKIVGDITITDIDCPTIRNVLGLSDLCKSAEDRAELRAERHKEIARKLAKLAGN